MTFCEVINIGSWNIGLDVQQGAVPNLVYCRTTGLDGLKNQDGESVGAIHYGYELQEDGIILTKNEHAFKSIPDIS